MISARCPFGFASMPSEGPPESMGLLSYLSEHSTASDFLTTVFHMIRLLYQT